MTEKLVYVASPIWDSKIDNDILEFVENLILGMGMESFIPALKGETKLTDNETWKRDLTKIEESEFVIAEVSQRSHGVGYEVAYAFTWKKPVIGLLKSRKKSGDISAMISGSPNVILIRYKDLNDLKEKLRTFKGNLVNMKVENCARCGIDTVHVKDECYRCATAVVT